MGVALLRLHLLHRGIPYPMTCGFGGYKDPAPSSNVEQLQRAIPTPELTEELAEAYDALLP